MELDLNEYLPEGARAVDAVLTVTSTGVGGRAAARQVEDTQVAEVIVIDASGSMEGTKFQQAREAAKVALAGLRTGTRFAILRGSDTAAPVYPTDVPLATASRTSVNEAVRALRRMRCAGGTAIGTWLDLASVVLSGADGIRHVTLLTDGRNEGESDQGLRDAVDRAKGTFQCDCRGVGTDWSVDQLRMIADALLGTVDIVADPRGLAEDFAQITARLMGRADCRVELHVWTPRGAHVEYFKQVHPQVVDLTSLDDGTEPSVSEYSTGAWGAEARGYQLRVALSPGDVGEQLLAARVALVVDGAVVDRALVRATWTDDLELSTKVSPLVGHYTGLTQMSAAIQQGLRARREGDQAAAQEHLGHATALAAAAGARDTLDLLARVVDIHDAATGRVRLLPQVSTVDEMTLDTRSTRTTPVRRIHPPPQ